MTSDPFPFGDANPSLDDLLAAVIQEHEAGNPVDLDRMLDRYPAHASQLRQFAENFDWLNESPTNAVSLVGRTIDRFELVELIARGGMGSVYLAKQEDLQRRVAIKLISAGVLATSEERSRFRTEAESAAQLNHPGIVAIHEIGDWQGHAYMVMQLIDGPTLSQWAIDTSRSDEERVAVLIAIADAVQYAHARGIIHRDLKPDNVLMDDGHRPLLTDFGLARWHAENHDAARTQHFRTQTGQLLGTPHYMAPE
ncbi:MAG: serine/threonine-protein kinase, partial [Planctomycetota bacterium]